MKKILALLLSICFVLTLSACGEKDSKPTDNGTESTPSSSVDGTTSDTSSETASTDATSSVADSSSKPATNNTTSSKPNTTSKPASTTPAKLNPKKDFKYGRYVTKFFEDNKNQYTVITLEFFEDFEGVQHSFVTYYSEAGATKKYEEWGSTFDKSSFRPNETVTVNGTVYYDIGIWGGIAQSYKMTDTLVNVNTDSATAAFSLNANGTLILESYSNTDYGMDFGPVGTIYTFEKTN